MFCKLSSLNKGLILHLPLSQSSFNPDTKRFTDKSGYCNNGIGSGTTLGGTPSFQNDNHDNSNLATSFNGSDDIITVPYNACMNTQTYSVAVWIYCGSITNNKTYCIQGDITTANVNFGIISWNTYQKYVAIFRDTNAETQYKDIADFTSLNDWNHVVYTLDGSGLSLLGYINGEATAHVNSLNYAPQVNTEDFIIGYGGIWDHANMRISGLRIYNRVLTPIEIKLLYDKYKF